jgi:tRNA nucleotidyltransferase/poly(A) polymerase
MVINSRSIDIDCIKVLSELIGCEAWLVGGAIRNAISGKCLSNDIDVLVSNTDFDLACRICSDKFGLPVANRHGNPRFKFHNGKRIDVFCPSRFFEGYTNLRDVLNSFDFTCNAVAYSFDGGFVHCTSALADISQKILRPIPMRWKYRSSGESAHLIGRAVRFIETHGFAPVDGELFILALNRLDEQVLMTKYGISIAYAKKSIIENMGT